MKTPFSGHYILDGREPVPCDDLMTWARWLHEADRRVAREELSGWTVSTVFLGLDHGWGDGPPLLFESMLFAPETHSDTECERCSTWAEAEAQHAAMVARLKSRLNTIEELKKPKQKRRQKAPKEG
jgi:hypothetical protein